MEESAEPTIDALEKDGPVKKSRRVVVLDAATFCIRSLASMVLVVSKVSCIIDDTWALILFDESSERTDPKAVENSSETIIVRPWWNSCWSALKSKAARLN